VTKAELIRKISKRSGVADPEAKVFFEILLRRIADKLKYGEAIKINNFGFFQLRQGIIKKTLPLEEENNNLLTTDLIVFSPLNRAAGNANENLIFNVPESLQNEYDSIDSYFSLSINKPVIPLLGSSEIDYFVPPTGNELEKLFESKVEKILEEVEIITEHVKGNEVLIIKANFLDPSQFEFNWEESKEKGKDSKADIDIKHNLENASEYEHVEWDFGENLSREIEEESILDVGAEPNLDEQKTDELNTGIDWNFGTPGNVKNESSKNKNEKINNVYPPDEQEKTNKDKDYLNTKEFEERVSEEIKKFQRVEARTTKVRNEKVDNPLSLTRSEMDLTWDFDKNEKEINDNKNLKPKEVEKTKEVKKEKPGTSRKDDFIPVEKKKDEDFSNNKPKSQKRLKSNEKESKIFNSLNRKSTKPYLFKSQTQKLRSRRTTVIFLIALLTIIVIGTALLMYLKSSQLGMSKSEVINAQNTLKAKTPFLINRDFDIPVSYPYSKINHVKNLSLEGIDSGLVFGKMADDIKKNSSDNSKPKIEKNNFVKKVEKKESSLFNKIGPSSRISNNIYKNGNIFIVQVSSWKNESIAVKQAEKFRKRGYTPYVEKTLIPGRGEWYRVRIGNFKSLGTAKKFSEKYK